VKRRTFLASSAFALSSLWIGYSASNSKVLASTTGLESPWIRISPENEVTVFASRAEMGQDAYTTIVMLIAEELDYPVEKLRIALAPSNPKVFGNLLLGGFQLTGASTSVRDAWERVRVVGATTRALLVKAAARRWNVAESQVSTQDGFVVSGSRRASYGEVAGAAASEQLPARPVLKDPSSYRYIGKQLTRLDTPAKVNGTAIFGVDVRRPGMLAAAVRQCPVTGGKLRSFDPGPAEKLKGVHGVYRIGDAVGVIADDFYLAEKGKALVRCEWEVGDTSNRKDLETIMGRLRKASEAPGVVVMRRGKDNDPLGEGSSRVEADYEMPFAAHAALEPMNCSASIDNGECHIWGPFQFPQGVALAGAAVSGLPLSQVRVHPCFLGGGFGRKVENDCVLQAVALAKVSGRAVRLIWSREDDMQHDFYRPAAVHRLAGSLSADGQLMGIYGRGTSHSVLQHFNPAGVKGGLDPWAVEGFANCTYRVPHMRLESLLHDTGVQVGFWRAVSNNMNLFALESFIDELALAARRDPVEFRLAMLDSHPRAKAVLSLAAERTRWSGTRTDGRALGIAQAECYQSYIAVVAEVSMEANLPVVHKLTAVIDCGLALRPDQINAQIEGGLIMGFFTAMHNRITFKDGRIVEDNFDSYPIARFEDIPQIEVIQMPSEHTPSGVGEAGVPLAAPAIANAIVRAGGPRIRRLPFV